MTRFYEIPFISLQLTQKGFPILITVSRILRTIVVRVVSIWGYFCRELYTRGQ
jgi:hypothetical protein